MAIRRKLKFDDLKELEDFPEVLELIRPHILTPTSLEQIANALCSRRDEAKIARTAMGLEGTWIDAEESYVGIDDANRAEWNASTWAKPASASGPLTKNNQRDTDDRSNAFIRITARYVDAGAAKLADIVIPVDGKPFSFEPLPEQEVEDALEDNRPVIGDHLPGAPILQRDALPHEKPPSNVVPFNPSGTMRDVVDGKTTVPLRASDLAQENVDQRHKIAKRAEKHVWTWMIQCGYGGELRKVIHDSAKLGVGVLKGPFPKEYKAMSVSRNGGRVSVKVLDKIKPAAKWVNPWNFFPDPACGEDIHDGSYTFERDYITEKQLRDLKRLPGYIESAIDRVIVDGPTKGAGAGSDVAPQDRTSSKEKRWEIWYYHGSLSSQEADTVFSAASKKVASVPEGSETVYVIATMVNDQVIKAVINPLESGSFPYHAMPWQRRAGCWAGIGVAEQVRTPQRIVNAAVRSMLDNAGLSSGPQIVMDKLAIEPADGQDYKLRPLKVWLMKGSRGPGGVKEAFGVFDIKPAVDQLLRIVDMAMKFAEESTSIPLVSEGRSNEGSPETFGATNLLNSNANQLLRDTGASLDIHVTEPFFHQLYEWFLLDDEVPDSLKSEFMINARGSTALIDRAIADAALAQMGNVVKDPVYGGDPRKWFRETLRVKRIHPENIMYLEQEWQKIKATPPPPAPAVQVAQIKQKTDLTKLASAQTAEERSLQNENQIVGATHELERDRIAAEDRRTLVDATIDLHTLKLQHELAVLSHANARGMKLADVHKELAIAHLTAKQHGGEG